MNQELINKVNNVNEELKKRLTVISSEDVSFYYHYDNNGELLKETLYYNQVWRKHLWLVINLDFGRHRINYLQ